MTAVLTENAEASLIQDENTEDVSVQSNGDNESVMTDQSGSSPLMAGRQGEILIPINLCDVPAIFDDDIAYSKELGIMVQSKYENIYKLWQVCPRGTLHILKAFGAVKFQNATIKVLTKHENTDNIETWKEYRSVIKQFWTKVNQSAWLEPARETLTNELYADIYKKFPLWPTVKEKEQYCEKEFNRKAKYSLYDIDVFWTVVGFIKITDMRKEERRYFTQCESDCMTLKVLSLHHNEAEKVEKLCLKDFEEAKQNVIKKGSGAKKMISWEQLDIKQ